MSPSHFFFLKNVHTRPRCSQLVKISAYDAPQVGPLVAETFYTTRMPTRAAAEFSQGTIPPAQIFSRSLCSVR